MYIDQLNAAIENFKYFFNDTSFFTVVIDLEFENIQKHFITLIIFSVIKSLLRLLKKIGTCHNVPFVIHCKYL